MGKLSLFLIVEIVAISLSYFMTPAVKGPDFLVYYFFLWFVLWAVAKLSEWNMGVPIIIYCSSGIARFVEGQEHGMSNFDLLWFMMFVGSIIYYSLAVDSSTSGGSSKGQGSGGCGGGGGSSSGGGCGGCGGD